MEKTSPKTQKDLLLTGKTQQQLLIFTACHSAYFFSSRSQGYLRKPHISAEKKLTIMKN